MIQKMIFECLHGSHAYGTATEESDRDVRGVFVPTQEYFLGFSKRVEQIEKPDDIVYYEVRKFFHLLCQNNPNIIELPFVPRDCITESSKWYERIRESAPLFVSAKCKHTFSGYAHAQLKRITGHKKWLDNPPKRKPEWKDFELPESGLSTSTVEVLGYCNPDNISGESVDQSIRDILKNEGITVIANKVREYKNALRHWEQYCTWRANRNPKRARLEELFHYDCYHASHLVRLLTMGKEILTTGQVIVRRPDAERLLAIRRGDMKYEDLIEWAEKEDAELTKIYNEKKYVVRHSPDIEAMDRLCMSIVEEILTA